jgi:hypothetical protein
MRLRLIFFGSVLFLITTPVLAREHTDVIVMKNGDRLTGQVKGFRTGVLYFDLDYVDGTVSVQWSKVARLDSRQPFIVKTQEGSVYSGAVKSLETSAGQTMKIQVTDQSEKHVALDASHITKLEQTSPKFWQRMNGALNFGTTYSKGDQSTQYNLSSQTEYLQEHWRAQASFSSNLASSVGANAATRNLVGLGAYRLLPWRNFFYGGLANFLQSSEQGIHLQTNLGGGIGRYLKNNDHWTFSVLGGMAWQNTAYEQSITPIHKENVATAMIAADLKAFKFKKTNLSLTTTVFPALSEPGRVFVSTNATYYIKLFGDLSWNFSFYGDWDNQPPGKLPGSDYGTSSGVTWTFGTR